MVPEGWQRTAVGDHVDLLSGFPFKSSDYSDDPNDIRLLRGDNIGQGQLRWREAKRWDRGQYQELIKFHLSVGDFVIAMDRTWVTGGLKVAEVTEADTPSLLLQRVSRLRAKQSLDQRLLRFLINGHGFEQYVKSVQTETAVPHISARQIREFPIALPPLPEQRKIAEILLTWDRAIETTEALLSTARTQKRALMQQLLTGKRRFPEFEGREWSTGKLIDHFDFINGRAFKPEDWAEEGLPIIRIQNLTGSTDAINYFGGSVDEKHMVREGDFLLSWSATLDTFIWHGPDAVLNQHIFKVVPFTDTLKMFGFHLISYEIGKLISKVHGTSMKHITKKDLAKITSFFPSLAEQQRITQALDAAQLEIDMIAEDLNKLDLEKKALMQQLLTGKRRVAV